MRVLRDTLAAVCLLAALPGLARAQGATGVGELLKLHPILKGVEYDVPADAAAVAACKSELAYGMIKSKGVERKAAIGYALRDGQGKMLRRFVDANADTKMDMWSYYQDGFEVYRETDLDGDGGPDECRWLNGGGTRVAAVSRGQVTAWKRVSAEEASKVLVQGLVNRDLALIETVLATPDELTALGVPKGEVAQVAGAAAQRVDQVRALLQNLAGWNAKTVWNRLDGLMPHLIPADAATGVAQDIILYENAVIFAGPPQGQPNPAKLTFLQAPEMVKLGETWKFVELPRAVDPDKPVITGEGGLRAWVFRGQTGNPLGENSPEYDAALKALAEFDNAHAKAEGGGSKQEMAQFHVGRIPLLRAVVKAAKTPEDQVSYNRQVVDSLAAAYQTGLYPNGMKLLDGVIAEGGKIAPYAALRKIGAVFAARNNEEAGENLMAHQKKWIADLQAFLNTYPKSEEAPEALLQLASASEFNAEEDDARKYYETLARDFPATDNGRKAAGALRRLDLVGKPIELRGPNLRGQEVDAAQYRGKTLLISFWASWADPFRKDLPELNRIYAKYRPKGFEIIGVNLDNDRADLDAFLKENPLAWTQVFEPGGIDKSPYAVDFGILSALPTMILVDPQGKVVNRNLRSAGELERQLDKSFAVKTPGVALDR